MLTNSIKEKEHFLKTMACSNTKRFGIIAKALYTHCMISVLNCLQLQKAWRPVAFLITDQVHDGAKC